MKKWITYTLLMALMSFSAFAGPAGGNVIRLTQPDGSIFKATISGDEYMKIKTTLSGHFIIQDENQWWCYGLFDDEGRRYSSGYRVGDETPQMILTASQNIPYEMLAQKARHKRAKAAGSRKGSGIQTRSSDGEQVRGKVEGLIILAEFKDVKMRYTRDDFVNLITLEGYSENGSTGSALDYLNAQFNGMIDFNFDISRIVTLNRDRSFYGRNDDSGDDMKAYQMVIDACMALEDEMDFTKYDHNGDGEVDNIFVFFAGDDEADGGDEDCIWSHKWFIKDGAWQTVVIDGKLLNKYACSSELRRSEDKKILAGIGTFCHEFCHTFELPDLYDTDYEASGGMSGALWGKISLMDSGNHNNMGNTPPNFDSIIRDLLSVMGYPGINPPEIIDSTGRYRLEPIDRNGRYYRINTENDLEYFLLENRKAEGWDEFIKGSGMLIYHIDRHSKVMSEFYGYELPADFRWTNANEVNCIPDHQFADLIEADNRRESFNSHSSMTTAVAGSDIRSIFFPYGKVDGVNSDTHPGFKSWEGTDLGFSITDITFDGDDILFSLIYAGDENTPPTPVNFDIRVFQNAAIITFESDREYEGEAKVVWGISGQSATETFSVFPYDPGKYAILLEDLELLRSYTLSISFNIGIIAGKSVEKSFMTSRKTSDYPYIYMKGIEKDEDGAIAKGTKHPLWVYNSYEAADIRWYFNGKEIERGPDHYYYLNESGSLKAIVTYEDGSTDTIVKEIVVR